ncbi:hypothetical protein ACFWEV_08680, partial [Streptomyces bacillaris]
MVPSFDVLEHLARALLLDEANSREVRDLSVWPLMASYGRLDSWTRCVWAAVRDRRLRRTGGPEVV